MLNANLIVSALLEMDDLDWTPEPEDPEDSTEMVKSLPPSSSYRFAEFKWLANMGGFGMPIDVYRDEALIGVIETNRELGYIVTKVLDACFGRPVRFGGNNAFKNREAAADALYALWKKLNA